MFSLQKLQPEKYHILLAFTGFEVVGGLILFFQLDVLHHVFDPLAVLFVKSCVLPFITFS